ncbi:MAG: hypothetical protein P1P78_04250 [Methyloprofundus sp.]|nr:hypothetical protein [Methyloprofundus sp.]
MKYYTKKARQAGMTLIELTVVLLVLIGLAGLMIPYVSGFVSKTHDSTGTWNGAALDSNMQRFLTEKMRFPNRMEALINGAAGTAAATDAICVAAVVDTPFCKMMAPGFFGTTTANSGTPGTTAMVANSLAAAGITDIFYNSPDTDNATFGSIIPGVPVKLNDGAAHILATVSADPDGVAGPIATVQGHLAAAFERPVDTFDETCYDYVVFGIGDQSELIGATMNTAPVHFASQGNMGPALKYNRFVAVFQVDKTGAAVAGVAGANKGCAAGMEPAKFVGTAMAMGSMAGHLWGTSHSLAHTWENIAAN